MSARPKGPHEVEPLVWGEDGLPRSRLYGDIYYSTNDGLAESRTVFLQGCGLPEGWRGRDCFVVAELGFGAGLNVAALVDLWRRDRPPEGRLHIFSVEAHPLSRDAAARALSAWLDLEETANALLARWPRRAAGFHRLELPAWGVTFDLAVMEVAQALAQWSGRADAWFLDGFSPALNPAMWRQEVLDLVAARSAPGARAATFTVAGAVRRGLAQAGFTAVKRPGHGRKRERLEAWLPAALRREDQRRRRVAVVGAGVAGACVAQAVRALGGEASLFEARAPGSGASGNPAALVTPRLDAGLGPPARLFAQAFARAADLYAQTPAAILSRGVLQLEAEPRDAARFAKIAASDLFEPGSMRLTEPDEVAARVGEGARGALEMTAALTVEPAILLAALGGPPLPGRVGRLTFEAGAWRLWEAGGRALGEADAVVLCLGADLPVLVRDAPVAAVRGQASWAPVDGPRPSAAAWGGYVAPTRDGVLFGATHDRGDDGLDVRAQDHARNLETLSKALPSLAARMARTPLQGRASLRAVTPDRLPLAGSVGHGLFVLGGLGSRGFTLAPLLANHVAALALERPSPLPADLAELVEPSRFARRAAARGASG